MVAKKRDRILPRYVTSRILADGSRAYYWQPKSEIVKAGQAQNTPLGTDLAEAVRKADRLNANLDARRRDAKHIAANPDSVDAIIESYKLSDDYAQLRPSTRDGYRKFLRQLANYIGDNGKRFGDLPAARVEPHHVAKIYERLKATGKRASAAAQLRAGGAAFAWARRMREGGVRENPFLKQKLEAAQESGVVWPKQIQEHFIAAAKQHGFPSLALACRLGVYLCQRPSDLRSLRYDNITADRALKFRQSKTGERTKQVLVLPLTDDIINEIEANRPSKLHAKRAGAQFLIRTREGKPYSARNLADDIADLRKLAGIDDRFIGKDWRHTGLTELGELGLNEIQLMAWSGHTSPGMLRRYVKLGNVNTQAATIARANAQRAAELQAAEEAKV